MNANQAQIVAIGLLFLFIFASGYGLSRSGKRRNAIVLTIHKLLSLAAVVLLGIVAYQTNRVARLSAIEWTAIVTAGFLVLGTMATGALLSADKPMPRAIRTLHRITPFLAALSTALALYLLVGHK